MKKFLKIVSALTIILALLIIFGQFSFMPLFAKVVWAALFVVTWLCRKLLQENVISWLQTIKNDHLKHVLWQDVSYKEDENSKITHEKKPNMASWTAIKCLVSAAIVAVFLGIPMFLYWIFSKIFGFFGGIFDSFAVVINDLRFANGVGFFIFAIFEILVTLAVIGFIIRMIMKRHKYSRRTMICCIAGAILLQRIFSWIYFEYTFAGVFGELFGWLFVVVAILLWKKYGYIIINFIRNRRGPRVPRGDMDDGDVIDVPEEDIIDVDPLD